MIFPDDCKTIVRTEPGYRTGETIYVCSDGSRWRRLDGLVFDADITGRNPVRYLHDYNKLCSHK